MGQAQSNNKGDLLLNDLGHKKKIFGQRNLLKPTGQPNGPQERPSSSRLIISKALSDPYLKYSRPNLDYSEIYEGTRKHRDITPKTFINNGTSEPILEHQTLGLKGKMKKLKPKERSEFLEGCVHRWEDFKPTVRKFNHKKKNRVSVLSSLDQDNDKRQFY